MITKTNEELIEQCKKCIEEKLGWGESENWINNDFEVLSIRIFEVTSVNLSPTTLKRIWGKVKYNSDPTLTTLNALSQFLGFEHWRAFRSHNFSINKVIEKDFSAKSEVVLENKAPKKYFLLPFLCVGIFITGLICYFLFEKFKHKPSDLRIGKYQFSSPKIDISGVPKSVIFNYDATASPTDSVYIQPSEDMLLRTKVSRKEHQFNSTYYFPGFFKAQFLIGSKIVKEQSIFIKTDGWLAILEQKNAPIYVKKEEAIKDGRLGLSIVDIKTKNVAFEPKSQFVRYLNVRDFSNLKTDNFVFETSVKNEFTGNSSVCQNSEIQILCEGSIISIPLSTKSCASENKLSYLGRLMTGKEHDLTGFCVDFKKFVFIRLVVSNGIATFFVNNKLVYQIDNTYFITKIVGIGYRFQGTGSVDWVKLSDNGNLIFEDNF